MSAAQVAASAALSASIACAAGSTDHERRKIFDNKHFTAGGFAGAEFRHGHDDTLGARAMPVNRRTLSAPPRFGRALAHYAVLRRQLRPVVSVHLRALGTAPRHHSSATDAVEPTPSNRAPNGYGVKTMLIFGFEWAFWLWCKRCGRIGYAAITSALPTRYMSCDSSPA
jgi:hypothetical protein